MSETTTTRSRLEELIQEAGPEVRRHADRLAPEGSSLEERAYAFLAARDLVALGRFRELARTAPRGSDERRWMGQVCSVLKGQVGLCKETLDFTRALRESARRRLADDLGRPDQALRAAPARVPPGRTTVPADVPTATVRRADRRRTGTP
jgi:hypothetical protein